jgi:transmembrane sensor
MSERLTYLFRRYFDKTATVQERDELMRLINDPGSEAIVTSLMEEMYLSGNLATRDPFAEGTRGKILNAVLGKNSTGSFTDKVVPITRNKFLWVRYAAAVAIFLCLSAGLYVYINRDSSEQLDLTNSRDDVRPGGNKAILTLSNGARIVLNDAKDGTLAQQGNASVVKLANGELAYKQGGSADEAPVYNTMSTPRGGQYKLQLPDGTTVMLNAESSITYPIAFTGKERIVTISGEAYFEVAKNKKMPFLVHFGDQTVEVLGTHFNISAYKDQPVFKTTLLEGSVKISEGQEKQLLVPGQQAVYEPGSHKFNVKTVDTDDILAWKNGLFLFDNTEIDNVMLQLARWYNIEVFYQGPKPTLNFTGEIRKDSNLSRIFKILESTGGAKFTINGNIVTVEKK